jgi:DNA uptake protein ComE-like DNA-binding protein
MERRFERTTGIATHRYAVNLNTASREELAALPGLNDDDANRIISHRPYNGVDGLLRKKVIGRGKYDQIQDMVYVRR